MYKKLDSLFWPIITITALLIIIGILFVYSASIAYSLEIKNDALFFLKRHLMGLCIGFVLLIIIQKIPFSFIKDYSSIAFFISLVVTALTLSAYYGVTVNGSSRWIKFFYIVFQPSELLKITSILYFSRILAQKKVQKKDIVYLVFLMSIIDLLLLQQPDFGGMILISMTVLILYMITHATALSSLITIFIGCIMSFFIIGLSPYRLQRIMTFLNPWSDPQGKGFQIIQSFIALGSGGFWGNGISHSSQKLFYLPMQHTDFIFSIIGEETGFFGCSLIIILYFLLFVYGLRISFLQKDAYKALVVMGFAILINVQALINIAVTCGLVPTKGIGLPFISYGNTNLVCSCIMLGFLIKAMKHNSHTLLAQR
jgi:cell division protein FtsW